MLFRRSHCRACLVQAVLAGHLLGAAAGDRALAQGAAVQAQQITVQQWVDDAWAESVAGFVLPDVAVRYRVEYHEVPTPRDLEALRSAVRGYPQHPDRRKLETYTDRIANGPDVVIQTMYLGMDGSWRLSRQPTGHAHQVDYACTSDHAWIMSADQLTVDAASQLPGSPHDLRSEEQEFRRRIDFAVLGGIPLAAGFEMEPLPVERDGATWVFRASATGLARMLFQIDYDEATGAFVPTRCVLETVDGSPQESGESWEMSDWVIDDVLGRRVAKRVEQRTPDGRLDTVFVIEDIREVNHRDLDRLCRIPDAAAVDEFRGPVTFIAIVDHRPGKPWLQAVDSSRAAKVPAEPAVAAPVAAGSRIAAIGRSVVIVSIALCGAAIILVRARARSG